MNEEEITQSNEQGTENVSIQLKQPKDPAENAQPTPHQLQTFSKPESTTITFDEPENSTSDCKELVGSAATIPSDQDSAKPADSFKNQAVMYGYCSTIQNYKYNSTESKRAVMISFRSLYGEPTQNSSCHRCGTIEKNYSSKTHKSRMFKWLAHQYTSSKALMLSVMTTKGFGNLCREYCQLRKSEDCPENCYCVAVECWRFYEKLYHDGCSNVVNYYENMNQMLCNLEEIDSRVIQALKWLELEINERMISNALPLLKLRLGKREPGTLEELGFSKDFQEDPKNWIIMQISDHLPV